MSNGKVNNNKVMMDIISQFNGERKSLLLHACCGPCCTSCVERVAPFFDVTVYFYNPNIHPEIEYIKRKDEIIGFIHEFNEKTNNKIKIIDEPFNKKEYDEAVRVFENPELAFEAERGERCRRCYEFRMKKTYSVACEKGFDFFATTLTLSPYKDAEKVNEIGRVFDEKSVESAVSTRYLYTDFKKNNGYLRSIKMSDEYNLYRQNYCGCSYSKINSEKSEPTANQ